MQLKLTLDPKAKHSDVATSVAWSNVETIFSCGDDHQLLMWNVVKNDVVKVGELPQGIYPTRMQWPPKSPGAVATGARKSSDLLLITSTDGHFYLLGRGARIEKTVQAHKGAILSGSWNSDGTEILTSGEDGSIRIWSRAGMLRSTIATCPIPIYGSCWSPDGQSVAHTLGQNITIKSTTPSTKPLEWKAHDGVILCLAWNVASNLIISGAEDCKYKVWDSHGTLIFSSGVQPNPITAVGWAPAGDLFAVGSFNSLRLCDSYGWSHCLEKPKVGSIYDIQWSADGTQFSGVGATGQVFLASVIERIVSWKTYDVTLTSTHSLTVAEFQNNSKDTLDFKDRILKISLDYGHLICVTGAQLYVYNVANVNTPIICDLKDNYSIGVILQSSIHFVLCGGLSVSVWSYEGRPVTHLKWTGMRPDLITNRTGTIATDMAAFIDQTDGRLIRVFDPLTGKSFPDIRMTFESKQIAFARNDYPGTTDRLLIVVDKNMDLHIVLAKKFGAIPIPRRLANQVVHAMWHLEAPMFACAREGKLRLHYFPQVAFIDRSLLDFTFEDKDVIPDLGKSPQILEYDTSRVSIRKPDGVLVSVAASPFMCHLHKHAQTGKFNEARRICRYVNNKVVWGVMAGLAASKQELDLAEICYSELELFDKVLFIKNIKTNSQDEPTRKANLAILCGNVAEAENILIQNKKHVQLIEFYVYGCEWEKALEVATTNNEKIEYVLKARKQYLADLRLQETLESFKNIGKKQPIYRKKPKGSKTKKHKISTEGEKGEPEPEPADKITEEPLSLNTNEQGDSL